MVIIDTRNDKTHLSKGNETDADFKNHGRIDNEFENVERKSRAAIGQAEYDGRDR